MKYRVVKNTAYLLASLVTVLSLAVVPVSAQHGPGPGGEVSGDGSGSTSGGSQSDVPNASSGNTEGDNGGSGSDDTTSDPQSSRLRNAAQLLLQADRKEGKEHTTAERQRACEQREHSIATRTTNFGTAAQRHLEVFNGIFTKVQAFQATKKLNVSNYDTLVAAATAKQATAQSAVDALKALNVQIDCTQTDPATSVATIKTVVSDARTALQAYRSALKDIIVALKGASTAQTNGESN